MKTKLLLIASAILFNSSFAQWKRADKGFPSFCQAYAAVIEGKNIFVATNSGVLTSADNGMTWKNASTGIKKTDIGQNIRALTTIGAKVYAASDAGIFLTVNKGASWTPSNKGLTSTDVLCLASNGNNLYAGTKQGGVFISTDGGASWKASNSGLTSLHIKAITFSGKNLYAGTNDAGTFTSMDNGVSWTPINGKLEKGSLYIRSLASNDKFIYTSTLDGVFVSNDNGSTWNAVTTPDMRTVNSISLYNNRVYIATTDGVFLSNDNENSWSEVSSGSQGNRFNSITFNGTNIFATSNDGIVFWTCASCSQ